MTFIVVVALNLFLIVLRLLRRSSSPPSDNPARVEDVSSNPCYRSIGVFWISILENPAFAERLSPSIWRCSCFIIESLYELPFNYQYNSHYFAVVTSEASCFGPLRFSLERLLLLWLCFFALCFLGLGLGQAYWTPYSYHAFHVIRERSRIRVRDSYLDLREFSGSCVLADSPYIPLPQDCEPFEGVLLSIRVLFAEA